MATAFLSEEAIAESTVVYPSKVVNHRTAVNIVKDFHMRDGRPMPYRLEQTSLFDLILESLGHQRRPIQW